MVTEKELLEQLAEAEQERSQAVKKFSQVKMSLMDAETAVINTTIEVDRAKERLSVWRHKNVDDSVTVDREEDIERFRKVLPDLMEKLK